MTDLNFFQFIFNSFLILCGCMTLGYVLSLIFKNMVIIDAFWGLGIGVVCTYFLGFNTPLSTSTLLFLCLMLCWSLRLGLWIIITRVIPKKLDERYVRIQQKWTSFEWVHSLGHFYMQASIQAILCIVIFPVYSSTGVGIHGIQWIATCLFILSLIGQTAADWQLYHHIKSGNKTICSTGLWSISRHPNYFFEFLIWLSFALFTLPLASLPIGFIAPLAIWVVMRYMTGPYTERLSLEKRGDEYKAYQQSVPMIIPCLNIFKKKESS